MGLTFSDHLQPGSKVPSPIVASPRAMTFSCPLPWNGRVSSGEPKFFFVSISSSCGPAAEPKLDVLRGEPLLRKGMERHHTSTRKRQAKAMKFRESTSVDGH